ncbi:hypothetical protein [Enterococcus faecium]|uniref:hypothetical protein n=1 Tax=Enterococcus faecium TaxID=1352 RepID=UPI001157BCA7|nr:hypothetical protein [Enterococcus faecium]
MDIKWLVQQNDSNLELAIKYLEETIFEDEHLTDNFLQVLKYLEIYSVKKNKLIGENDSPIKTPIELSLRNRMGILQRSEIVKELFYHKFSYEIRLDDTYEHYRIVFFVYNSIEDATAITALTFGFTKNGTINSDKTRQAATESDDICKKVCNGEENYWIGEEKLNEIY